MKKLLAIVLAFALVLSLSAVAFAADESAPKKVPSPVKRVSSDDMPSGSEAVTGAAFVPGTPADEAKIIANEDLTEEQKAAVDAALEDVAAEGYLPVDSFAVESDAPATVTIDLEEGTVVFVVYPDGTVVKLALEDLTKVGEGRYEIPVDGDCVVVIAKEA